MSGSGNMRMLVLLVLFLALLTVASIILSVVAMTSWRPRDKEYDNSWQNDPSRNPYYPRPEYKHPELPRPQSPAAVPSTIVIDSGAPKSGKGKVYHFGVINWWNVGYVDADFAIAGMGIDLVRAMCDIVGITCKFVYAEYSDCLVDYLDWRTYQRLGDRLDAQSLAACIGYFPNQERLNVAIFSTGMFRQRRSYLYYDNNRPAPSGGINGKRVGTLQGYPTSEKCVAKEYGSTPGVDFDVYVYPTPEDLLDALDNGVVDLGIMYGFTHESLTSTQKAAISVWSDSSDGFYCSLDGAGLIARKDHKDFIDLMNQAFYKIRTNGIMEEICASNEHDTTSVNVDCVETFKV